MGIDKEMEKKLRIEKKMMPEEPVSINLNRDEINSLLTGISICENSCDYKIDEHIEEARSIQIKKGMIRLIREVLQ